VAQEFKTRKSFDNEKKKIWMR